MSYKLSFTQNNGQCLNKSRTENFHEGFNDYILVIFLIITSGYLSVSTNSIYLFIPISLITIFLFFKRGNRLDAKFFFTFSIIALLLIFQRSYWGGNLNNIILPFSRYIIFYMMATLLLFTFRNIFPKLIYIICVISLIFWTFDHLIPSFHNTLLSLAKSIPQTNQNTTREAFTIFLYTVDDPILIRNSGPFFEPGRFSIVIVIALLINLSHKKKLYDKHNIILILSIVSTFSTTGFLSLLVILTTLIFIKVKENNNNLILIIVGILLWIYIINLDFMIDKISSQSSDLINSNSRFGAFVFLIEHIKKSPIIGYGSSLNFVFDGSVSSPNGIGEIIRWWGIPFSLIYFYYLTKGSNYLVKDKKWYITSFLCLIILSFSQSITLAPIYYFITFIGLVQNKK